MMAPRTVNVRGVSRGGKVDAKGGTNGCDRSAGARGFEALDEFVPGDIFQVRSDLPKVPEGIAHGAAAISVVLILQGRHDGRTRLGGLSEQRIGALDVEVDGDGRAPEGFGAEDLHLRILIDEHEAGVADLNLGMGDSTLGILHAGELRGTEGATVEVEGGLRTLHDETGGNGAMAFWNGINVVVHKEPPEWEGDRWNEGEHSR